VSVIAVNDAPDVTFASLATHPAASTGARSVPGFATFDAGPGDEDATQSVAAYLIDAVVDPAGVLAAAPAIGGDGTLTYALSGIGGEATVRLRVRDDGGTANGGVDTSVQRSFAVRVTPGADLEVAMSNAQTTLVAGATTVYAIVVANAGPNAVDGAVLTDLLPAALIDASWTCVPSSSTATCPSPGAGTGNLIQPITLGVGQFLRFDLIAEVDAGAGAFVSNTASVSVPAGTTALDPADDSATDTDAIVPSGMFGDGFESTTLLSVPGAERALRAD
jgi:uncharacterized repeat protein (TIGR01451 family)